MNLGTLLCEMTSPRDFQTSLSSDDLRALNYQRGEATEFPESDWSRLQQQRRNWRARPDSAGSMFPWSDKPQREEEP